MFDENKLNPTTPEFPAHLTSKAVTLESARREANDGLGTQAQLPSRTDILGLIEAILKNRDGLERLIRRPTSQPLLVPRFLAISLLGFTLFGIAMSLVFHAAHTWPQLADITSVLEGESTTILHFKPVKHDWQSVFRGQAFHVVIAYAIGLIAASGVCLPSLYFYGLLAGVRMSMLDVVVHTVKSKATAAVALVGLLPIYAALALGMVVFQLPERGVHFVLWLGLLLPFIAGLWGTASMYRGFMGLADTMPAEFRARRACFLQRLVLSWTAVYTAVTPVMIFTLWEYVQR